MNCECGLDHHAAAADVAGAEAVRAETDQARIEADSTARAAEVEASVEQTQIRADAEVAIAEANAEAAVAIAETQSAADVAAAEAIAEALTTEPDDTEQDADHVELESDEPAADVSEETGEPTPVSVPPQIQDDPAAPPKRSGRPVTAFHRRRSAR